MEMDGREFAMTGKNFVLCACNRIRSYSIELKLLKVPQKSLQTVTLLEHSMYWVGFILCSNTKIKMFDVDVEHVICHFAIVLGMESKCIIV